MKLAALPTRHPLPNPKSSNFSGVVEHVISPLRLLFSHLDLNWGFLRFYWFTVFD